MSDQPLPKELRLQRLAQAFTPSAAITNRGAFHGRVEQIFQIASALNQPGNHAVIYGERGVGKTSLANLLPEWLGVEKDGAVKPAVRFNCSTQDTFQTLWRKAFREMEEPIPDEWKNGLVDPDDVRWTLARLAHPRILVFDEFDRVENDEALSLMADTLKALSDHATATKLVIVGVADSLTQLIGEHASVARAVEEISMPRMQEEEVEEIIVAGLEYASTGIEPRAKKRIVRLVEGLPHYAHLITLKAGFHCIQNDRNDVNFDDVKLAIGETLQRHEVLADYQMATRSSRQENLFGQVLAACALADKDRLGCFTASAVRTPLSKIMSKPYDIPAFAPHLKAFTGIDRGSVLRKEGALHRPVYRFTDPRLQPFAIMIALQNGWISGDYEAELFES